MENLDALRVAKLSLDGLSVGDAFGELFFSLPLSASQHAELPAAPWRWTDDTHMALSIVETLKLCGRIEQDQLARAFARRYTEDPFRGYAAGAARLLSRIAEGADWREASSSLFKGGSYGNGAAMRAAPIGAFFSGDPQRAAEEARLSAVITHAHPEGQAGAMGVAVAAALVAGKQKPSGRELLQTVMDFVPESEVRQQLRVAVQVHPHDMVDAVQSLGTGRRVTAQDTVPFCLWCAAFHLDDYEKALRWTLQGLGDRDTTCAIVGGIVALSAPEIPGPWLARREPLPDI